MKQQGSVMRNLQVTFDEEGAGNVAMAPDQVKLAQQPAPKKTIKQLVDLREAAANRLDVENGLSYEEQWDQESE
jgi:hypothetical protein